MASLKKFSLCFFSPVLCSLTATHPTAFSSHITFCNPPKLDQLYLSPGLCRISTALHCIVFPFTEGRYFALLVITVLVLSIASHTSSIHIYLRNKRNHGFFHDTGLEYLNQTWRALHKISQTVYYILLAINCGKRWSILMYYWENSRLEKQVDGSEHIYKWVRCVLKGTFTYISFEPLSIQEKYLNSHFSQMKA